MGGGGGGVVGNYWGFYQEDRENQVAYFLILTHGKWIIAGFLQVL